MVTRKAFAARSVCVAALIVLAFVLVPVALAGKGAGGGGKPGGGGKGGGGGGGSTCTRAAPRAAADNNWAWGQAGSWGLPGQQLEYGIDVINNDLGCGSTTFVVGVSAPTGFSVSNPTSTITLNSGSTGYVWVSVTSPTGIADGDYPLTITTTRSGDSSASAFSTTYYKLYSSDTVAPTLFWPSPADGGAIGGGSYAVTVQSTDDHAVRKIDLYIDNVYRSTTVCADISYQCQLYYNWSTVPGQHSATFKAYDWIGNVGVLTTTFTAG